MIGNLNKDQMLKLLTQMLKSEQIAKGGKALDAEMARMGYGKKKGGKKR